MQSLPFSLAAGRPGMAAVDVFDEEPLRADPPVAAHRRRDAAYRLCDARRVRVEFSDVFDQVVVYTAGRSINVVKREVPEHAPPAP